MVLSNSTPNNNRQQHEMVVDTAAMNSADLDELLQLNAEIEERRSRHAYCDVSDGRGLLRATMTREELFEVSSLDDDRFLTALEHQNSYSTPSRIQITDLDLSSIENLMRYFDEEVPVTPSKDVRDASTIPCTGKVASTIAKLASQPAQVQGKPQKLDSGKKKISELKQKYEQPQLATPQSVRGANRIGSSKLPMKVKEMAQLFNSKINQVMRRAEAPQYATLHNELSLSPEPKPKPKPQAQPQPKPREKLAEQEQQESFGYGPCLVAEDVFRELSVKDKVLLFNKFVSDIAAKHPKFNEHAADLKAQATKQMARGEVVAEHQASVKHLAQELEAKCVLQSNTPPRPPLVTSSKTKSPAPSLHVSTLTVVLKPSPERHVSAQPGGRGLQCASQKRNLAAIRSVLPTEAYAPPKKIRRTRQERAGTDNHLFFQNEPLESLFYSWLSAENGILFDITCVSNSDQTIEIASGSEEQPAQNTASSMGDISQKSAVERLLEEAIAKLELESRTKEASYVEDKDVDTATTPTQTASMIQQPVAPVTPTPRKLKRQAPPVPAPRPSLGQTQSTCITSSSSSSCKQSEAEESESGLSTLPKITSDESQPEMPGMANEAADFEFAKPVRPPRKKKMRRTLTWKKENSIVEATANAVTSTDSDSDYKPTALQAKKKPSSGSITAAPTLPQPQPQAQPMPIPEQSYIELDRSLMRQVNSPRKIKSAYTLTVMSSPSPNADSDQSPLQTPRASFDPQLRDSFIDQGFETCSNDAMDNSPLRRSSVGMVHTKPSGFSTPVKGRNCAGAAQQQLFSPIGPNGQQQQQQLDKSRRSSLAMQVIREDHPLDLGATCDTPTTSSNCSERDFFANAPTVEMSSSQLEDQPASKPLSKFWITAGDFTVGLEIAHNTTDRLRLLYEIFTQKAWETRELTFGIDAHKFCRSTASEANELPERPASVKGSSHYWFASGDLAVPFSGKYMPGEKIERLFEFLDAELSTGPDLELRFGVDQFEFSSVPEFWVTTPKFSIESSYSMLVGLQTGGSNGLEGRSKYAWPNNQYNGSNNAMKTSDLDQTEFESDSFSNSNQSGRLSFSPDLFSQEYEAVPLDELFDKTLPPVARPKPPMSMPQMLCTLQQQKNKLKSVEERIRSFQLPPKLNEATFKQCRSRPEFAQKLRTIENLARSNGFSACSMEELESFMQFLFEYADTCLGSCSEHIEKIIDTLMQQRSVLV
ncbi:uncharacterized protein LOC6576672 [Drosophila mojavensis]|uniref:Uncharacterized protein n=1 Tax=Drosophila mojavensis TaxID=7230 RepID=B4KFX6_DROMO|nr:uncharacterized protein LOC6576672 [Drosophila mojavensis]EDW12102.1 uncharacterized protein Dmoj_GI11564 [Drosophila mojavensis]